MSKMLNCQSKCVMSGSVSWRELQKIAGTTIDLPLQSFERWPLRDLYCHKRYAWDVKHRLQHHGEGCRKATPTLHQKKGLVCCLFQTGTAMAHCSTHRLRLTT